MADGRGGSTTWTQPGYVEPPRDSDGVNRSLTDYAQDPAVQDTRGRRPSRLSVFRDRRAPK